MTVAAQRVRALVETPPRPDGDFVLYWMIAARRAGWNFGLQRSLELCAQLGTPLLVLEPLRCNYPWASARFHRFVIEGMLDNRAAFEASGIAYWPWIEPAVDSGKGMLEELAGRAAAVVTDDYPTFFVPRMLEAVAPRLPVAFEAVDSNGLLPMRAAERVFPTAYGFRGFLQRNLLDHLDETPAADPLRSAGAAGTPGSSGADRLQALGLDDVVSRFPSLPLGEEAPDLADLPIDHDVAPTTARGGTVAARRRLAAFIDDGLERYAEHRNDLVEDPASALSPWLHFGQLSSHEVLAAVAEREDWTPGDVSAQTSGKRTGWWSMSAGAEAYLDQLVTWRELGFNMCWQREDHDRYESLPEWAQKTLAEHAGDERPYLYTAAQLEEAATHEPLWNAAQNQLRREGRIHNYLRMLWGKKILHWTESPLDALEIMVHLNNKYALDGRDPNSWSGIFWCLGRYDRAWGPERPVFGKIRYMSARNTRRKLRVDAYVERLT